MSSGRARRSLADWTAEVAADRPPPPTLETLPATGAMLEPHRDLRAALQEPRRHTSSSR